jgi:hypothetical protein
MPFITYRETLNGDLRYYILQKSHPHFVGEIVSAPSEAIMLVPITRHSLWVKFAGTIYGNMIPSYRNIQEEMEEVYTNMAEWFYQNRILPEPKKYKKWLLPHPTTT